MGNEEPSGQQAVEPWQIVRTSMVEQAGDDNPSRVARNVLHALRKAGFTVSRTATTTRRPAMSEQNTGEFSDAKSVASKLREYAHNPHHTNPMSQAFARLIEGAASLLAAQPSPDATHLREVNAALVEALERAVLDLETTRTNAMVEINKRNDRWEGVPNLLKERIDGYRAALATPPAQVGESYPDGVTERNHIAHDMRVGRFPKRSSIAEFLAERAPPTPSVPWEEQVARQCEEWALLLSEKSAHAATAFERIQLASNAVKLRDHARAFRALARSEKGEG